jgi:hypothetical protein
MRSGNAKIANIVPDMGEEEEEEEEEEVNNIPRMGQKEASWIIFRFILKVKRMKRGAHRVLSRFAHMVIRNNYQFIRQINKLVEERREKLHSATQYDKQFFDRVDFKMDHNQIVALGAEIEIARKVFINTVYEDCGKWEQDWSTNMWVWKKNPHHANDHFTKTQLNNNKIPIQAISAHDDINNAVQAFVNNIDVWFTRFVLQNRVTRDDCRLHERIARLAIKKV